MKHLKTFESYNENQSAKKIYIDVYEDENDDEMWCINDFETKKTITSGFYGRKEAENFAKEIGWFVVDKPSSYHSTIEPRYSNRDIKMKRMTGIPIRGIYRR